MIDRSPIEISTVCPFCGQDHDAVSEPRNKGAFPEDGDVTLCFHCGEFCAFDHTACGGLRKPTKQERREILRHEEAQQLLTAWKTVKRQ